MKLILTLLICLVSASLQQSYFWAQRPFNEPRLKYVPNYDNQRQQVGIDSRVMHFHSIDFQ
jgi:hypothetical protein